MSLNRSSPVRKRWRREMMHRQRGLCHWCQRQMQTECPDDDDFATFEHMKRKRDRGKCCKANLVLACRYCNLRRA